MSCCAPLWLDWLNQRTFRNYAGTRLLFILPPSPIIISAKSTPEDVEQLARLIDEEAKRHGLQPVELLAYLQAEQRRLLRE